MNKKLTTVLIAMLMAIFSYAQVPHYTQVPNSVFVEGLETLPAMGVTPPDLEAFKEAEPDHYYAWFARAVYGNWDMMHHGTWTDLPNGDRVWQIKITSPDAKSLQASFDWFYIPAGAYLIGFNEARSHFVGPYDSQHNEEHRQFATGTIPGETMILQYYEPARVKGQGVLDINRFDYGYRAMRGLADMDQDAIFKAHGNGPGDAADCSININCQGEIGDDDFWQKMKKSVVKLTIYFGGGAGNCSGTLMNNTSLDQRLLIFSAFHCQDGGTVDYNRLTTEFDYEHISGNGCDVNNPTVTIARSMIGGVELSKGFDSDFWLYELNGTLPSDLDVIYAGWDRNDGNSKPASTGISHPRGDVKKIHTQSTAASTDARVNDGHGGFDQFPPNSHWTASLTEGLIEPGSSGSSMMLDNGNVVGVLHAGGGMNCDAQAAGGTRAIYGKFSWAWDNQGASATARIRDYMDPINSGVTILDYLDPKEASNDVIVSEFATANAAAQSPHFLELFNANTSRTYNIGGVKLNFWTNNTSQPSFTIDIPDNTLIEPQTTFVIAAGDFPASINATADLTIATLNMDAIISIEAFNETTGKALDIYGQKGLAGAGTFWDYTDAMVHRQAFVFRNNQGEFLESKFYEWTVTPFDLNGITPGTHTASQPLYDVSVTEVISPSSELDVTVCDNLLSPEIRVSNLGRNKVTSFDVVCSYFEVGSSFIQTASTTVNEDIKAGETKTFDLTGSLDLNMEPGKVYDLEIAATNPSGQVDGIPYNDGLTTEVTVNSRAGEFITLYLNTDVWGNETTWEIKQGSDIVASGGPYEVGFAQLYEVPVCADPYSCFNFTIRDSRSDGLEPGGYFYIIASDGDTLVSNGNYLTTFTEDFCLFEKPAAPQNVRALGTDGMDVILGWDDLSVNETGFEIEVDYVNLATSWQNAGSVGADETQFAHTVDLANQATTYRVRAVLEIDGFKAISEWTSMSGSVMSLEDELSQQTILYPNPATSSISVSFGDMEVGSASFAVSDITGRQIMEDHLQAKTPIDISNLPKGIYMISLHTKLGMITKQFIVE